MTDIRIRLYENDNSSVIGFGPTISEEELFGDVGLNEHLSQHGQTIEKVDTPEHLKHLNAEYYRIEPPLEESQIRHFAQHCLRIADTGHNSAYFIDNRRKIPERPLQTAGDLLNWVG
jgi:hypothetical protein